MKTPPGVRPARVERKPVPELATLVDKVPEGEAWIHELKFDGYRLLARLERGSVTLLTRNGNDWTERVPELARALAGLRADSAIIDGELVALDQNGVSDFQLLQNSLPQVRGTPLAYYAFDLLYCDGNDWRGAACLARKAQLATLLGSLSPAASRRVRMSEHVHGRGDEFFRKACAANVEGIISKRKDAPYRPGRGRDWLKVKCSRRQEFVIVGYSDPAGARRHLGALLLGVQRGGALEYAGRVGTGFSDRSLAELQRRLAPLGIAAPAVRGAPRGAAIRGVHWVRPELVAEVSFTGFTEDGRLRHPSFRGLREDKSAAEVFAETSLPAPELSLNRRRRGAART